MGILWKILSNPEVSSTRHLPWVFFGFLPQRRKYEGIGTRDAQRQEQEPSQRPHGEQSWPGELHMVGLPAVVPETDGLALGARDVTEGPEPTAPAIVMPLA